MTRRPRGERRRHTWLVALPLLVAACTGAAGDGESAFLELAAQEAPAFARDATDAELLELGKDLCASADETGQGEFVALGSGRFVEPDEFGGLWRAALEHLCPEKRSAQ